MDDRRLVEALRDRDPGASAAVYDAYADRLYAYCWFLLRGRDAAQVALRDAFIVAEAHVGKLRDPDRFRAWLYAVARLECGRRLPGRLQPPDLPIASHDQDDVDQRVMAWQAVLGLDPLSRELLELRIRHGLPVADIAAVVDLPVKEAQAALDRAHAALRVSLSAEILAHQGPYGCPGRGRLLRERPGDLDTGLRERLVEHAEGCRTCGAVLPRTVSAAKVFGLLPRAEPPADLRVRVMSGFLDPELIGYRLFVATRVTDLAPSGFPVQPRSLLAAAGSGGGRLRGRFLRFRRRSHRRPSTSTLPPLPIPPSEDRTPPGDDASPGRTLPLVPGDGRPGDEGASPSPGGTSTSTPASGPASVPSTGPAAEHSAAEPAPVPASVSASAPADGGGPTPPHGTAAVVDLHEEAVRHRAAAGKLAVGAVTAAVLLGGGAAAIRTVAPHSGRPDAVNADTRPGGGAPKAAPQPSPARPGPSGEPQGVPVSATFPLGALASAAPPTALPSPPGGDRVPGGADGGTWQPPQDGKGALSVAPLFLDLADGSEGTVLLRAEGGPVDWTAKPWGPVKPAATSGRIEAGQTYSLTVRVTRSARSQGEGGITFQPGGTQVRVSWRPGSGPGPGPDPTSSPSPAAPGHPPGRPPSSPAPAPGSGEPSPSSPSGPQPSSQASPPPPPPPAPPPSRDDGSERGSPPEPSGG